MFASCQLQLLTQTSLENNSHKPTYDDLDKNEEYELPESTFKNWNLSRADRNIIPFGVYAVKPEFFYKFN